jgi:hypothetical protein
VLRQLIIAASLASVALPLAAATRVEKLACKTGTEDRHARIALEVVKGKVRRFAYYSKWKPDTCSVAAARGDAYSKWVDKGNVTTVTLPKGTATIEALNKGREIKVTFRNLDRDFYCGMDGEINGTVTVFEHKAECGIEGVMDNPSEAADKGKDKDTDKENEKGKDDGAKS